MRDHNRELYITWSDSVEVSKQEMKTALVKKFGEIVQTTKTRDLPNSPPIDGYALLKVGYYAETHVLKGEREVTVSVNGKKLTVKESHY